MANLVQKLTTEKVAIIDYVDTGKGILAFLSMIVIFIYIKYGNNIYGKYDNNININEYLKKYLSNLHLYFISTSAMMDKINFDYFNDFVGFKFTDNISFLFMNNIDVESDDFNFNEITNDFFKQRTSDFGRCATI